MIMTSLKIGMLGSLLAHQSLTGVEKYLYHLVHSLSRLNHIQLTLMCHAHIPLERLPNGVDVIEQQTRMSLKENFLFTIFQRAKRYKQFDIIHCPTVFAPFFLKPGNKPKVVMTVHDLVPALFPEFSTFIKKLYYRYALKYFFSRVDHFIVPSKSVLSDMVKYYSIKPHRISVVYEGVSGKFRPCLKPKKGYILAVGTIEPRKNFRRIIESYISLKQSHKISAKLIIVGKRGWACNDVYNIPDYLHKDIIFKGYVSDIELISLYQNAKVFVYPSLNEGFGLPVVEAMACGCPVVTSHLSSLPEVAGKAALLVDPHNTNDIACAIIKVLNNEHFASTLRKRGLEQVKNFTWLKCAQETAKVYETVLNI
jgi:glycosyltransferase involved in cell wall biosynthesis